MIVKSYTTFIIYATSQSTDLKLYLSLDHLKNRNDTDLPEGGCGLGAQRANVRSHQLCDPENEQSICEAGLSFAVFNLSTRHVKCVLSQKLTVSFLHTLIWLTFW